MTSVVFWIRRPVAESDVQLLNPTFSFWIPSGDSESDSNLLPLEYVESIRIAYTWIKGKASSRLWCFALKWICLRDACDQVTEMRKHISVQFSTAFCITHWWFCYAVCEIPSESKASFHRAAPRELAVGTKKSSKGSWRKNYAWEVLTRGSPDLLPKK